MGADGTERTIDQLWELLQRQQAEIQTLTAELQQLRSRRTPSPDVGAIPVELGFARGQRETHGTEEPKAGPCQGCGQSSGDRTSRDMVASARPSRRTVLKAIAGAAAVTAGTGVLLQSQTETAEALSIKGDCDNNGCTAGVSGYATNGATGIYGESLGVTSQGAPGIGVFGFNDAANGTALSGFAVGTGGTGVFGRSQGGGIGVYGLSDTGFGGYFMGGDSTLGGAQVYVVPQVVTGPPTDGYHSPGELWSDVNSTWFLCSSAGTPGTWRRLALETPNPNTVRFAAASGFGTANGYGVLIGDAYNNNANPGLDLDGIEGKGNHSANGVRGDGGPVGGTGVVGFGGAGGGSGVIGVADGGTYPGPGLGIGVIGMGGSYGVHGVGGQGGGVRGDSVGGYGLYGVSTNSIGVDGTSINGTGVVGESTNAYGGMFFGGLAPIRLSPAGTAGAPTSGNHLPGEVYPDMNGVLWVCVAGGTPGVWKQLATTDQGIHTIPTVRVLNTRPTKQIGPYKGPIANNTVLSLTLAGANGIPSNATGVTGNLTAADATAPCFLALVPHGASHTGVSSINFPAQPSGTGMANSFTVGLSGGQVDIYTGNCTAYTVNIIMDITGYIV